MAKRKTQEEQQEAGSAPIDTAEEAQYFSAVLWKGVKEIYRCAICGTNRDERDAMIEHVLIHFPVEEHERIFELLLLKEK